MATEAEGVEIKEISNNKKDGRLAAQEIRENITRKIPISTNTMQKTLATAELNNRISLQKPLLR